MTYILGSHVNQVDVILGAQERGASIAQVMLGDPQGWKGPRIDYPGGAQALKDAAEEADITLVVHAPYVINVASTNNRVRIPSRKLLQKVVNASAEIGAIGVVVHGGHVTINDSTEAGFENWFKCVDRMELPVPIFIENTAGGKNAMARYLDRIEMLWAAINAASGAENVGFCLDTCHAHAAGIGLDGIVAKIMAITGRIDLVHSNDSRDKAGSGADRHANLGEGLCDPEELVQVVRDAGAPVVVETPGGAEAQAADIEWLRARLSE